MVKQEYVPDRGDVVWLDMDPSKGHEQRGMRPALVLSPKKYNAKAGLMLACPITSKSKGYAFEVACKAGEIDGVILADHVRSLDWMNRRIRFIVGAPREIVQSTEARLLALIRG